MFTANQDCRNIHGEIAPDIVATTKQYADNGVPDPSLGVNGNTYIDLDTGIIYQKNNGAWVEVYDSSAAAGGTQFRGGDGILLYDDDPAPLTSININQNITTYGNSGEDPWFSLDGGATVSVRKITNNDGFLGIGTDAQGAISIDNNLLVEKIYQGAGITVSSAPGFINEYTISNDGLLAHQAVGLPAASEISRTVAGGTLEIMRVAPGSNIVTSSDFTNGLLISTSDTPNFTRVETNGGSQGANAYTATTGPNNAGWYHSAPAGFSRYNICINNNDLSFFNQSNFVTNMTAGNWLNSIDNNINLGSPTQRFIAVYATNGTIQTSDERMKKDISPLNVGLNMITQINPIRYKWNDDDGGTHNRTHWGYSAQQVKSIMDNLNISTNDCDIIDNDALKNPDDPEAVDLYAIRKSAIQPIIINAIKEQQQIINSLLARVAVLESKHP